MAGPRSDPMTIDDKLRRHGPDRNCGAERESQRVRARAGGLALAEMRPSTFGGPQVWYESQFVFDPG